MTAPLSHMMYATVMLCLSPKPSANGATAEKDQTGGVTALATTQNTLRTEDTDYTCEICGRQLDEGDN